MSAKPPQSLRDRVAKLTEKFVAQIERAIQNGDPLPWRRPWVSMSPTSGKGRPYKGLNQLLLACSSFSDPRWYTMNLANELGGRVRKGEKGTMVYFWKVFTKAGAEEPGSEAEAERRFILRTYYVWNYDQIDWLAGEPPVFAKVREVEAGSAAQPMIDALRAFGVPISHEGDRACYSPSLDRILMPARATFESDDRYAAILAHEVTHSTGHPSRLNRDLSGRFGSEAYAMEELVAELGSALLCGRFGIESGDLDKGHVSYLNNWLQVLRRDPYALFTAARMAQAACDLVAGKPAEEEGKDEEERAAA